MNYKVTHTTTYNYAEPVAVCHNEARLRPLNTFYQQCQSSEIIVDPPLSDYHERIDFFGNRVAYFSIQKAHKTLSVSAVSIVNTLSEKRELDSYNSMTWEQVYNCFNQQRDDDILDAKQYILNSPLIVANQEMASYAERSFLDGRLIVDAVQDLMERIHRDFTYDPHFTT
ncbi:transglutaminase N-terminal domain-containing protein, partial [Kaarinaea lacus]